jgi:hypothetical protein
MCRGPFNHRSSPSVKVDEDDAITGLLGTARIPVISPTTPRHAITGLILTGGGTGGRSRLSTGTKKGPVAKFFRARFVRELRHAALLHRSPAWAQRAFVQQIFGLTA